MKIYLAIGLICLLSVSAFSYVAPRDENRVPASVVCDRDGNFLAINPDGSMYIIASTNSVILSILKPVTTYLTISQFEELAKHTTVYMTESQWRSLKEETTTFITASQVVDLKVVSLPDGTTVYITDSQLMSLKEDTSSYITNFPTDFCDSKVYEQLLSSVTVVEKKYLNKVSTGTSDKITGVTSQQIVIANDVTRYQFTFVNSADGSVEASVTSSIDGDKMYFYDGFWKKIEVDIPQPITFDITMPVTSTFTYKISEVKQP